MRVMGWGFALVGLWGFAGSARAEDDITIEAAMQQLRYECNGRTVINLVGAMNRLTLTGECARVVVNSANNQISIEAVGAIDLVGAGNVVTWQRGLGGRDPRIRTVGVGNQISRVGEGAGASAAQAAAPPTAAAPARSRARRRVEVVGGAGAVRVETDAAQAADGTDAATARVRVRRKHKQLDVSTDADGTRVRVKRGAKSVDVATDPETGGVRVKLKGAAGAADLNVDSD